MNEIGIDTAFANYVTQQTLENISFGIFRLTDLLAGTSGTNAYYSRHEDPDEACLPNMQLLQNNGKPAGMYFFSHAWNAQSAAFEANYCCDQLDAWGFRPQLGIFMDFERLGASGRVGGFENLVYLNGGWPSAALVQSIFSSWFNTVTGRGYKAGLYVNADPINAATNAWIQSSRFDGTLGSPYLWVAQWEISTPSWDCDIWQYDHDLTYYGTWVDMDRCMNDRIFQGGSSALPVWLKLYLARGDKNGKCTVLL